MSTPADIEATKIWCSNVVVKNSSFCTPETGDFDGAFAKVDFAEGELIEKGIMRRLPEGFNGHECQECFTWSTERPNKTWAMGSGCSPYYNTHKSANANTRMVRYFDEDRFEIFAKADIKAGEELLHTYISLGWRECFAPLNEIVNKDE
ncbi:hypothetical protein TrST_g13583 [Triparma strigata]|uniref:SET domain-containing protein n=1 Tax=Triparma strigata TaxID=1606541 RepID=A0A9W7E1K2_9STRA|nr:hypothetical protein TrST_g13583 [Triparma strigata]